YSQGKNSDETTKELNFFNRKTIKALEEDRKQFSQKDYVNLYSQIARMFLDPISPDGETIESILEDLICFAEPLNKNQKSTQLANLLYATKEISRQGIITLLNSYNLKKDYKDKLKTLKDIYHREVLPKRKSLQKSPKNQENEKVASSIFNKL